MGVLTQEQILAIRDSFIATMKLDRLVSDSESDLYFYSKSINQIYEFNNTTAVPYPVSDEVQQHLRSLNNLSQSYQPYGRENRQ